MHLTCHRGATYEYRDEDQRVDLFSVSQIRRMAHDPYVGIPEQAMEAARHRGTVLHKRFWRLLASQAGLMPVQAAIPQFAGYCTSMDEWVMRNQVMPVKIEEASLSLKFGYAGTPDALVTIGPKQFKALIDLKSGAPSPTDPMQLIAYQKLEGYEDAAYLVDVYIQADGSKAKEGRVTSGMKATEWCWFLAALGVLQSRVNHNCK
jgi:hypothetical protein